MKRKRGKYRPDMLINATIGRRFFSLVRGEGWAKHPQNSEEKHQNTCEHGDEYLYLLM